MSTSLTPQKFLCELFNLYACLDLAKCGAYSSKYWLVWSVLHKLDLEKFCKDATKAAWEIDWKSRVLEEEDKTFTAIGHVISAVSWNTTWKMSWKFIFDEIWERIYEANISSHNSNGLSWHDSQKTCRNIIANQRQIRSHVGKCLEKKLLTIGEVDQVNCLEELLNFNCAEFKRSSLLQQCDYMLRMERIIYLSGHWQLLTRHRELVNKLGLERVYTNLHWQDVSSLRSALTLFLPSALVDIILDYVVFSWLPEEEDQIFKRLLTLHP